MLIPGCQNHQLEIIHSLPQLTIIMTNTSLISRMLFLINKGMYKNKVLKNTIFSCKQYYNLVHIVIILVSNEKSNFYKISNFRLIPPSKSEYNKFYLEINKPIAWKGKNIQRLWKINIIKPQTLLQDNNNTFFNLLFGETG